VKITFVKKVLADGSVCRKCRDVENRLRDDGWMQFIDETVVARENDPESAGMRLAALHGVKAAPFFLVAFADGRSEVHSVYLRFVREVLRPRSASDDHARMAEPGSK
jgi:hypothetical protein